MDSEGQFQLKQLLHDFDWDKAVIFYEKYGINGTYKSLFNTGRTTYYERKLYGLLQEMQEEIMPSASFRPEAASPSGEISFQSTEDIKPEYPEPIQQIIKEKNTNLATMNYLQGQLEIIDNDEQRAQAAGRILELDDEITKAWDKIHHWEQYQELIHDPADDHELTAIFKGVNGAELVKIRNNYRSYVSRATKGKMSKEKLPFYEKVLQEAERRLANG